ncbi:MAG: hypothetical protein Nkreftii_002712 [Candidatus Nitrospira kreftii]|uniref:Uncharacterized protein n=1 Tax=Candidatus Nitrospira kreftii TaxID=2652173 RepID=A0A7S8J044_9BACT|nr:MAG: hypothetical protein Nkreftii_002712 [Candidatus Nitrospira kreftii]
MTVRDLIQAYRDADTPRRNEDERHAGWWIERIGGFPVGELSPELIKRQLLASAKCGRSVWTTIQSVLNHRSLKPTSIYARLNTKAVDRALQTQADRFCSIVNPPAVIPETLAIGG